MSGFCTRKIRILSLVPIVLHEREPSLLGRVQRWQHSMLWNRAMLCCTYSSLQGTIQRVMQTGISPASLSNSCQDSDSLALPLTRHTSTWTQRKTH